MDKQEFLIVKGFIWMIIIILIPIWAYFTFFSPIINVWQQSKLGEAELARADSNRQIAICEAFAIKESSKALADAEVIRAEGVSKANLIIGESLKDNESYLRYLWVQGLQTNNMQVVYIPTEANMPILESTRLKQ
jgi:hypothetical protein